MHPDEFVPPPPAAVYLAPTDLTKYASRVRVAGLCFLALGLLYLVSLIYLMVFASSAVAAINAQPPVPGSRAATESPAQLAAGTALLFFIIKIPSFIAIICSAIAAIGLLGKHTWGRIATIIVSIPLLIVFPVGTLLAAYAIYLMVKTGSAENWALLTSRSAIAAP